MSSVAQEVLGVAARPSYRWVQLVIGIVCMAMIANLQYGWTLFVSPIDAKYHWGRAAIQVAFSIFVLTETWLVPIEGWFVDRFGPRIVVLIRGILVGIAWVMNAMADSLTLLYIAAAVRGVGAGGLMATAQLGPSAKDFKIDGVPVSLIGITLPALTFALSIDRILNGVTRPFFGWVSDNIGRENTMFIAFGLEAVGIWMLGNFGHDPVMFVILSGLVFFAWVEIYSLFPSTCTDVFGPRYATTNAGLLYTAQRTSSLLVPFGNLLAQATGSWYAVFMVAAVMNLAAALADPFVLKPLPTTHNRPLPTSVNAIAASGPRAAKLPGGGRGGCR